MIYRIIKAYLERKPSADLNQIANIVKQNFGAERQWFYGDCVAFAKALRNVLKKLGVTSQLVYFGDQHAAVRVGGKVMDARGWVDENRKEEMEHHRSMVELTNRDNRENLDDPNDPSMDFKLDFVPHRELPYSMWKPEYGYEHCDVKIPQRRLEKLLLNLTSPEDGAQAEPLRVIKSHMGRKAEDKPKKQSMIGLPAGQYLGTGISKEIAHQFVNAARFQGKDSAIEANRKAIKAFEELGLPYEMVNNVSPRLKDKKSSELTDHLKSLEELQEIQSWFGLRKSFSGGS